MYMYVSSVVSKYQIDVINGEGGGGGWHLQCDLHVASGTCEESYIHVTRGEGGSVQVWKETGYFRADFCRKKVEYMILHRCKVEGIGVLSTHTWRLTLLHTDTNMFLHTQRQIVF